MPDPGALGVVEAMSQPLRLQQLSSVFAQVEWFATSAIANNFVANTIYINVNIYKEIKITSHITDACTRRKLFIVYKRQVE